LIQKILHNFKAQDNDTVGENSRASAADQHLQQDQLSAPLPPSVDSTGNANANARSKLRDKGIIILMCILFTFFYTSLLNSSMLLSFH